MQTVSTTKELKNQLAKRLGPGNHPLDFNSRRPNGSGVISSGMVNLRVSPSSKGTSIFMLDKPLHGTDLSINANKEVSVVLPAGLTSFELTASKNSLFHGQYTQLSLVNVLEEGYDVSGVTYALNDSDLGSVSVNGRFTAGDVDGTAVITATVDGVEATFTIEVTTEPVTEPA